MLNSFKFKDKEYSFSGLLSMLARLVAVLTLLGVSEATEIAQAGEDPPIVKLTPRGVEINASNIPVAELLYQIGKVCGLNVVINTKNNKSVSVVLTEKNCEHALKSIASANDLAYSADKESGGIQIRQKNNQDTDRDQFKQKIISIKFADMNYLSQRIGASKNELLSKAGKIYIDEKNKIIVITETAANIEKFEKYIRMIDKPDKQVILASYILSVDKQFMDRFGSKVFAENSVHADSINPKVGLQVQPDIKLSLSAPLRVLFAGKSLFDISISAMQRLGNMSVLANPRLLVRDRETAVIESGEKIPYQEKNSRGTVTLSFNKASLSLSVMPEVVSGNKVRLHIDLAHDQVSEKYYNDNPSILTRKLKTEVTLANKETLVLGGISMYSRSEERQCMPKINKIPIIGKIFCHRNKQRYAKQLIIMIVPSVLEG